MRASIKRLIWALGYPIMSSIGEFVSYYGGKVYSSYTVEYAFISLWLWFVPLLFFKDDKNLPKSTTRSKK